MKFKFTKQEITGVFKDPQVFQLVIDYHENQIAMAEALEFDTNYHYERIRQLKEAKKEWD